MLLQCSEQAGEYDVTLMVTAEPEQLGNFITMRSRSDHTPYTLDDSGVILTEKLAKLLIVSAGDTLQLKDAKKPVRIAATWYADSPPSWKGLLFGSARHRRYKLPVDHIA